MVFFKKQHEEIAVGFLKCIDFLLREQMKDVAGYSIDKGVETLKLKIGKTVVTLMIEGDSAHYRQENLPIEKDPLIQQTPGAEAANETLY